MMSSTVPSTPKDPTPAQSARLQQYLQDQKDPEHHKEPCISTISTKDPATTGRHTQYLQDQRIQSEEQSATEPSAPKDPIRSVDSVAINSTYITKRSRARTESLQQYRLHQRINKKRCQPQYFTPKVRAHRQKGNNGKALRPAQKSKTIAIPKPQ